MEPEIQRLLRQHKAALRLQEEAAADAARCLQSVNNRPAEGYRPLLLRPTLRSFYGTISRTISRTPKWSTSYVHTEPA